MKKNIILIIIGIIIGFGIGFLVMKESNKHLIDKAFSMGQETEVWQFSQAAEEAYFNQPTSVAIWALENCITGLNRTKKYNISSKNQNHFLILSPVEFVCTHGRVAILYKKDNNIEKYNYHINKAISLSREYPKSLVPIDTEKEMIELLERLDKRILETFKNSRRNGGNGKRGQATF